MNYSKTFRARAVVRTTLLAFSLLLSPIAFGAAEEILLNVNFAAYNLVKEGFGGTGQTENDYWNRYTAPYLALDSLPKLRLADGSSSSVGLTVQNGGGHWAFAHPDAMYSSYAYAQNFGTITVTVTNLPDGTYNVYLYGHGPSDMANTVFQVLVGLNNYGNQATTLSSSWSQTNWMEGSQYVVYREVNVTNGGAPLVIKCHPGAASYTHLAGMQIEFSTAATAPSIVTQPTNQTVLAGATATFSVSADGSEPLGYQWRLNGTNLVGKTTDSLVLSNVQSNQVGNYSVVVSNAVGFVISSNALLTVIASELNLLNVDFVTNVTAKTGFAAVGRTASDYWNVYSAPFVPLASLSNLTLADGSSSSVGLTVQNGAGHWGSTHPDAMYSGYAYAQNFGTITVTVTNLPDGTYDIYLYGHGPSDMANTVFQVLVGLNNYGNQATTLSSSWSQTNWMEGSQYVVYREVNVTNGGAALEIKCHPGASGYTHLAGMQIESTPPNSVHALSMVHAGDQIQLLWPVEAAGLTLQSSTNLSFGWQNVVVPLTTNGGVVKVTLTNNESARFFRLQPQ